MKIDNLVRFHSEIWYFGFFSPYIYSVLILCLILSFSTLISVTLCYIILLVFFSRFGFIFVTSGEYQRSLYIRDNLRQLLCKKWSLMARYKAKFPRRLVSFGGGVKNIFMRILLVTQCTIVLIRKNIGSIKFISGSAV